MPEPISVCMIVKNEEHCIETALKSVCEWANEIIIVDTGSTDRTIEFASRYTSNIYEKAWTGSFSEARNFSLDKASSEWVLILDADEAVNEESRWAIHELLGSHYQAGRVSVRSWLPDGNTLLMGSQPTRVGDKCFIDSPIIRIFRNRPDYRFTGALHEVVDPCFFHHQVLDAPNIIFDHYGKLDVAREAAKAKERLQMALREAEEHPDRQTHLNAIQEAQRACEWTLCIKHCNAYMGLIDVVPFYVMFSVANALVELGDYAQGKEILAEIMAQYPDHAPSHVLMGRCEACMGHPEKAEQFFIGGIARGNSMAAINLVELYRQMGKPEKCMEAILAGLNHCPNDPSLVEMLSALSK